MKDLSALQKFASSPLPNRFDDDDAFRAEMQFVETDDDVIAFARRFDLARSTVRAWRSGEFAPHPALRLCYGEWLRERAAEKAGRSPEHESRA